jgi:protein involved in polysaccharide export with SLBB domain
MKRGLVIVALAVFLSGCTGSNRGKMGPVFSEVPSPTQWHAYNVTDESPATNTSRDSQNAGVIQVGDALLFTFNLPGLIMEPVWDQRVKDDGTITLIYNRVFHAAGKKTGDLEKEIRDYYVPTYFTDMTVMVRISREGGFVYVDGEFRKPGIYSWTNGMRLKDAIDAAGGFTEFSNHKIKVIHNDGTSERFRLRGDWERTNNPVLNPGDKIHNPRQLL